MKYHPDRNPGREVEVNSKFQIIQSAHEVLTDPQQKASYDATLGRSNRFPAASGVRGNPWQNVSQQYPTPPRRNPTARNATSGAQRWHSRFSNGVPPTAKQQAPSDAEAKKNAARGFENMRKPQAQAGFRQQARPSQPPPMPPRTESVRQRREAAFGSQKTGFHPRSSGDESPVSGQNYYSRTGTEQRRAPSPPPRNPQPDKIPDPLSQFRARPGFADPRQSTPYSSHGGERTDPFDGIPLGRSKSTREPRQREDLSISDKGVSQKPGHGNSDAARTATSKEPEPSSCAPRGDHGESPLNTQKRRHAWFHIAARAALTRIPETASNGHSGSPPSMYDVPHEKHTFPYPASATEGLFDAKSLGSIYGLRADFEANLGPSGNQGALPSHSFEVQQHLMLDLLISNVTVGLQPGRKRARYAEIAFQSCTGTELADELGDASFDFAVGDDAFDPAPPVPERSAKSSIDDINTTFVNDDHSGTWRFSAGNGERSDKMPSWTASGGAANRRSPLKRQNMQASARANHQPPVEPPRGFNADGWSDKFSPQTFVPQPTPSAASSPTRLSRANSKKVRIRPTAGNAAVVDESSSDDETYEWRGRNAQAKPAAADSPQAMDIDSPPSAAATSPAAATGVRNMHVEPSRPEWRPGNVDATAGETRPERPEKIPVDANTVGSEDSEEFKASFAELRNTAPLKQSGSGLKSLADLGDNLPFESQASKDIPIQLPKVQHLVFPDPPDAPRLPPAVAVEGLKPNAASWVKYLADFESYLAKWDEFNGQVVDHFATRRAHISRTRGLQGYAFLGARGDGEVWEYFNWVQQDNDVRQRWNACCDQHEKRLREFIAFREKMK